MNKYFHAYARKADDIGPLSISSAYMMDKPADYDSIVPMPRFQKLSRLLDGRLMKGDPIMISRRDIHRLYCEWHDRFCYTGAKLSNTASYMAVDTRKDSPELSIIYGAPVARVVTPQKSFTIYPI